MEAETQLALFANIIFWLGFFYLLSLKRWNLAALASGVLHMLYVRLASVIAIHALFETGFNGLGIGFIQLGGAAAAPVASLILTWALASSWLSVGVGRGRWMLLVAVGDLLWSANMGGYIMARPQDWVFQLGEALIFKGVPALMILLSFFVLLPAACALWAASSSGVSLRLRHIRVAN